MDEDFIEARNAKETNDVLKWRRWGSEGFTMGKSVSMRKKSPANPKWAPVKKAKSWVPRAIADGKSVHFDIK